MRNSLANFFCTKISKVLGGEKNIIYCVLLLFLAQIGIKTQHYKGYNYL